jgi:hypothetical protein
MKKHSHTISFWKKCSLGLALILVALIVNDFGDGQNVVQAQGLNNNASSGGQLFCKRDFGNFITNGLDFDGEGFTDYWRDILVIYNANYCQFSDIDSLLNRIDKARKQIRQAFYVCDTNTTKKATAEYYQMSAELYYLRHFVDTTAAPNPKNTEEEKAQKVQLRADVKGKFMDTFVRKLNYFDQANAELIFEKIRTKYESKLESYRNCTDPNYEQLLERVKSIGNTFKTIEQLGKKFAERTQKRFSAMEKRIAENPGLISAFNSDGLGDFMNRATSFRVNNEPVQNTTVWEQISNTAKENTPGTTGPTKALPPAISMDSISSDFKTIKKRQEAADLDLIYVSEYDLKYRQVSGAGLDKLRVNLDTLKETIISTFAPMDKVRICAANIVGKQCGG